MNTLTDAKRVARLVEARRQLCAIFSSLRIKGPRKGYDERVLTVIVEDHGDDKQLMIAKLSVDLITGRRFVYALDKMILLELKQLGFSNTQIKGFPR